MVTMMLLVLVLTVASVVVAEAGYQYNAPTGAINQPAPFTLGHHSRPLTDDHDKPLSHSVSYKDYIYLNKDVERLPSAVKNEAPLNILPVGGNILNNGYAPSFVPSSGSNLHINSGYSYNSPIVSGIPQTSTLSGVNLNAGYAQSFTPQITVTTGSGFNNNVFAQSSSFGANQNNGYAQTFAPAQSIHLNSGYSNGLSQSNSIGTGFSHGNVQTSPVAGSSNLNNGYSYSQPQPSGFGFASSNGQASSASASSTSNSGFSQSLPHYNGNSFASGTGQTVSVTASANVNNGFAQSLPQESGIGSGSGFESIQSSPIVVSSDENSGYSYSRPQTGGNGFVNGNVQTSSLSGISNQNTGYSQSAGFSSNQPVSDSHFSSGYSNEIASSGSSSLSNTYNTISSATSNLNSGIAQSEVSSSGGNFNNGFIQGTGFANPATSSVSVHVEQSSTGSANSGFVQSTGSNNLNTGFSQQGSVNQAVFKHIYFHAPPPEIEDERFGNPAPPPKKNYKIIFIKVPSQESKSNLARLQLAQTANGVGGVEHKTLIYVLVKNPETQQVTAIPKKVPSEHEVFFVKYNGNPLDIAARVNDEIDQSGSVQSIVPLEPGLVNGHKY